MRRMTLIRKFETIDKEALTFIPLRSFMRSERKILRVPFSSGY